MTFELQPGDVAFHHCMTMHASGWVVHPAPANVPIPRRRGYSVHYMRASSIVLPTDVKSPDANVNPATGVGEAGYLQVRGRSFEGRV